MPPWEGCEKFLTINDDPLEADIASLLEPKEEMTMAKRTRWAVLQLSCSSSDEETFDDLWEKFGAARRRISVARLGDQTWAVLYKGDQAIVQLGDLCSALVLPAVVHEIAKPTGGQATRNAVDNFVRTWFTSAHVCVSNFRIQADSAVAAEDIYEDTKSLTDRELHLLIASTKLSGDSQKDRAILKCKAELKALRCIDRKEEKAAEEIRRDPCYCAATPDGLHMPTDFVGVDSWVGETWCSTTRQKRTMTYTHWLNSPEHLERTAVVFGDSGSGKTAVLHGTGRTLATRYQAAEPFYLCAGTVNGLRSASRKGLLRRGVPRIIEDYTPKGHPNGQRQSLEEYLVNLLNVKDGGTIDLPGGMQMIFPAGSPQIISTNRKFEAWIEKFMTFPIELQHAISKRIVFFTLPDTPLVKAELRKRREEDMNDMVMAGLEREKKFLRDIARESASTSVGDSSPTDDA